MVTLQEHINWSERREVSCWGSERGKGNGRGGEGKREVTGEVQGQGHGKGAKASRGERLLRRALGRSKTWGSGGVGEREVQVTYR